MQKKQVLVFGNADEGALQQAKDCLVDADYFCLMADNHKGYNMPIGGVAAYKNKVSPAGVGFDIACGNKAVKLDVPVEKIKGNLSGFADEIFKTLSFGVGRINNEVVEHDLFDDPAWEEIPLYKNNPDIKQKARAQLGTIGSGNHYVDVFVGSDNHIWVGVHFGSRGLGHRTATEFILAAGGNPNGSMDGAPALLDADSEIGKQYIQAMTLCGRYAYAGRDWVCKKVSEILGGNILDEIHNHHNFAWLENHHGQDLWVVRKGATPAFPEQRGFVGASMGEDAVIIKGVDSELSKQSLYSTVHGAGRVMSRTQAAGKSKWIKGVKTRVTEGLIDIKKVREEIKAKGIELRGAGADEAPAAYKRLTEVLESHKDTIAVETTLSPLIVCMAGENEYDPYKD